MTLGFLAGMFNPDVTLFIEMDGRLISMTTAGECTESLLTVKDWWLSGRAVSVEVKGVII